MPAGEWGDGFDLAPGTTTAKTVECAPLSLGRKRAKLTFRFDVAGQGTGEIGLTVAGGGPQIAVEPERLDFGRVAFVSSLSTPKALTVLNVGAAPAGDEQAASLRFGTPTPNGTLGPPYYRIEAESPMRPEEVSVEFPPGFPETKGLWPNAQLQVIVRLTPASAGIKQGTLVLLSNDIAKPELRIPIHAEALALPPCDFKVVTPQLDYGVVHATSPRTLDFVLENIAKVEGHDCLISDLRLGPDGGSYFASIPSRPFSAVLLPPGKKLRVPITFAPTDLPTDEETAIPGTLQLRVSSPTRPLATASLTGAVGPTCLLLLNKSHDFGTSRPGRRSVEIVPELENVCDDDVTVTAVTLVDPEAAFELDIKEAIPPSGLQVLSGFWTPCCPAELVPPHKLFGLRFAPSAEGEYSAVVRVDCVLHSAPVHLVFSVRGRADAQSSAEDRFSQGGGGEVDIVLVTDWGGRPELPPNRLAPHASDFIAVLDRANVSYHIGVLGPHLVPTQGPVGQNLGLFQSDPTTPDPFLTNQTPAVANMFALKIAPTWTGQGQVIDYDSRLADLAVWRALSPAMVGGPHAGFRRPTARLAILIASRSATSDTVTPNIAPEIAFWIGERFGPNFPAGIGNVAREYMIYAGAPFRGRVTFAALDAFDELDADGKGCSTDESPWIMRPSKIYSELLTGARLGDWCPKGEAVKWKKKAEMLAEVASGLRLGFPLSNPPDLAAAPIEVMVNGAMVPSVDASGHMIWSYDTDYNSVRFQVGDAPLPGSDVVIRYRSLTE